MLAGVCRALASRGWRVSVLARHEGDMGPGIRVFECDYTRPGSLESGIERAIGDQGPPALWVTWIHSHASSAERAVREAAGDARRIRVLGSGHTQTPAPEDSDAGAETVLLGFVIEPNQSRWLTHEEICTGVLRAIDQPCAQTVVGVLEPDASRPS